tara:strand:- start:250 stop:510 length:261 start_codon:yes stop_codon:yes gene_type:complete
MGKNWQWSYQQGRIKRLKAEVEATMNGCVLNAHVVPLHSHCGTMQSHFAKGWHSVTQSEIYSKLHGHSSLDAVKKRLAQRLGVKYG